MTTSTQLKANASVSAFSPEGSIQNEDNSSPATSSSNVVSTILNLLQSNGADGLHEVQVLLASSLPQAPYLGGKKSGNDVSKFLTPCTSSEAVIEIPQSITQQRKDERNEKVDLKTVGPAASADPASSSKVSDHEENKVLLGNKLEEATWIAPTAKKAKMIEKKYTEASSVLPATANTLPTPNSSLNVSEEIISENERLKSKLEHVTTDLQQRVEASAQVSKEKNRTISKLKNRVSHLMDTADITERPSKNGSLQADKPIAYWCSVRRSQKAELIDVFEDKINMYEMAQELKTIKNRNKQAENKVVELTRQKRDTQARFETSQTELQTSRRLIDEKDWEIERISGRLGNELTNSQQIQDRNDQLNTDNRLLKTDVKEFSTMHSCLKQSVHVDERRSAALHYTMQREEIRKQQILEAKIQLLEAQKQSLEARNLHLEAIVNNLQESNEAHSLLSETLQTERHGDLH